MPLPALSRRRSPCTLRRRRRSVSPRRVSRTRTRIAPDTLSHLLGSAPTEQAPRQPRRETRETPAPTDHGHSRARSSLAVPKGFRARGDHRAVDPGSGADMDLGHADLELRYHAAGFECHGRRLSHYKLDCFNRHSASAASHSYVSELTGSEKRFRLRATHTHCPEKVRKTTTVYTSTPPGGIPSSAIRIAAGRRPYPQEHPTSSRRTRPSSTRAA